MKRPLQSPSRGPSRAHPADSTLNRRRFLRALGGGALALPALELFTRGDARAQEALMQPRFIGVYFPNGFNMDHFWPAEPGRLNAESLAATSHSALAPWAQELLLLNGLDNHAGSAQGDGPGDHARGTCTFLTCAHPLKSAEQLRCGESLDQRLARHWEGQTRFASLELGCEGGGNASACDSGYSCAYSRNIAWRDESTPLPKETNPRLLFERLFGAVDPNATPEARARRLRRRQSVLDFVLDDATQLQRRLGAADRRRLDGYLTGIREIETRMSDEANEQLSCDPGERPAGAPRDRGEYARLMLDILVEAMRCDLTRVGTFMFGNGGSNRAPIELGINEGHHELSHHQRVPETLEKIGRIDAWELSLVGHLLGRLSEAELGGATLLEQTTLFVSSEIADGNAHGHYEMPVLLAGRAGGLERGRYVDLRGAERNNQPLANLFLQILHDAGRPDARFGDDGTAPLIV